MNHIDDTHRAAAAWAVERALWALATRPLSPPKALEPDFVECRDEGSWPLGRAGRARVLAGRGTCIVRAGVLTPSKTDICNILGTTRRFDERSAAGLASELQRWSDMLDRSAPKRDAAAAVMVRNGLTDLLVGAATAYNPGWSVATIWSTHCDAFQVRLELPSGSEDFTSDGSEHASARISPELLSAIRAATGSDLHVSEGRRLRRGRGAWVAIGAVPTLRIGNPGVVAMMRALRNLPDGAALAPDAQA